MLQSRKDALAVSLKEIGRGVIFCVFVWRSHVRFHARKGGTQYAQIEQNIEQHI